MASIIRKILEVFSPKVLFRNVINSGMAPLMPMNEQSCSHNDELRVMCWPMKISVGNPAAIRRFATSQNK
jgi:hypothetical protein